jgi:DNA polymerase III alpha subunit (gram-positive type)
MNTLTAIEADRVVQLLKHAIDRLQIISYLPSFVDEDLLAEVQTETTLKILEKLWGTEENFSILTEGLGPNDLGAAEIELLKKIHIHTRTCCRNLQLDRHSLQIMMSRPETQSEEFTAFIRYLMELKAHVYSRLTTTVEDEAANRTMLHELTERERRAEESKEALQTKLNEVRVEKENTTYGLDQILRKLQLELQDLTVSNRTELDSVRREMSEAISKAASDHELRMRQLQDQVDNLERQSNETMEKNREEELRMRKEKSRAEHALSDKISLYDEDMDSRRIALEEMTKSFREENEEYLILKEYFDKIDADLMREREENDILDAVARREAFAARMFYNAAVKIQSVLARGRQARKFVAALKAKKGGKGKKGKK